MRRLLLIVGLLFTLYIYPQFPVTSTIDTYLWGDINPPTSTPDVEEEVVTSNGTIIKRIAPSNIDRYTNRYSKLPAFNRNGTIIKQISSGGGTAFYEVSTGITRYIGVDGGGRWANSTTDPNLLYVTFRYSNDLSIKMQRYPDPYGSETLLHDFTDTHTQINIGMNEGDCDWDDKYMPIAAQKNDGTYELVVLDLDDAKANPNQPSNIYSRMPLLDGGNTIIDWVSISPTGDYVVIAYFGNYDLNSFNGNAIVAYDNTAGSPTNMRVVNLTESHAALGIDVFGEDVYMGIKDGASDCPQDCLGQDDDTFLIMSRLRDGETVYKFRDTGDDGLNRGYYGGYITTTNFDRQGYAYVIEGCCARDDAPSNDMFAIRLDYDDIDEMEYFFRMNSNRVDGTGWNYATVAPNGYEFVFNSYWYSDILMSQHSFAPSWYAKYEGGTLTVTNQATNQATVLEVEYYNMLGQKLGKNKPTQQGIYIEVSTFEDRIQSKLIPVYGN